MIYIVRDMEDTVVNGVFSSKALATQFAETCGWGTFIEDWAVFGAKDIEEPIPPGTIVYLTIDMDGELEGVYASGRKAICSGANSIEVWRVDGTRLVDESDVLSGTLAATAMFEREYLTARGLP